jgi:CBS domain-containing protein
MTKKGYTQFLVTDDVGKYIGMLTDFVLLNRILYPQEKGREWLKHFRN